MTMNKVKTLDDLKKMRESLRASLDLREKSNTPDQLVQIKVSMATCGIAAGAFFYRRNHLLHRAVYFKYV